MKRKNSVEKKGKDNNPIYADFINGETEVALYSKNGMPIYNIDGQWVAENGESIHSISKTGELFNEKGEHVIQIPSKYDYVNDNGDTLMHFTSEGYGVYYNDEKNICVYNDGTPLLIVRGKAMTKTAKDSAPVEYKPALSELAIFQDFVAEHRVDKIFEECGLELDEYPKYRAELRAVAHDADKLAQYAQVFKARLAVEMMEVKNVDPTGSPMIPIAKREDAIENKKSDVELLASKIKFDSKSMEVLEELFPEMEHEEALIKYLELNNCKTIKDYKAAIEVSSEFLNTNHKANKKGLDKLEAKFQKVEKKVKLNATQLDVLKYLYPDSTPTDALREFIRQYTCESVGDFKMFMKMSEENMKQTEKKQTENKQSDTELEQHLASEVQDVLAEEGVTVYGADDSAEPVFDEEQSFFRMYDFEEHSEGEDNEESSHTC